MTKRMGTGLFDKNNQPIMVGDRTRLVLEYDSENVTCPYCKGKRVVLEREIITHEPIA